MIATYTAAGRRHRQLGQQGQDALTQREKGTLSVIVLADGVSTCLYGGEGARCCADAAAELLMQKGRALFNCEDREMAEFITAHVVYKQRLLAKQQGHPAEEYASTLAAVCYDRRAEKLLYCSLGDSLILAVGRGQCTILALPPDSTKGCCVTMTRHAEKGMQTGILDTRGMESVCILSDGAWEALFEGGCLKEDVRTMLVNHWYEDLREHLQTQNCEDENSFILMDLKSAARRYAA